MLFFLSLFLFLSSSHHLLALRRVLHQPFFPVESPPFFPVNPSSPPPPPSPASLPANISSLIIPPVSKSPSNSRKVIIFTISAVTSTVFVSGFILLLYCRSRSHGCNHSDDNKTHPSDSSRRVESIDQPPPPQPNAEAIISKQRSTSSEFLYLTTPVTSREPEDQSLCNRSLTGSISRNVDSPDLHNLPPLSFHVNRYVDSMEEEEDTEEEFYSPKGSSSTLSRPGFESQTVLVAISGVESKSIISCSSSSSGSPSRSTFISISPSMSPTHTKSESSTAPIAIPETLKSSLGSSGSSSRRISQGSPLLSLASLSLELSHVKQLPMENGSIGIVVDPERSSRSPSLSSTSTSPERWVNRITEAHLLSTSHSSAFTSPDRNFQKDLDPLPIIMNNLRQGLHSHLLSSDSSPINLPKVSSPNPQSPSASSRSDFPESDFSQNVDVSPKILHLSSQIVRSPTSSLPIVGASRMPPTPPPPPPLPPASLTSDYPERDFSESVYVSSKILNISTKIVQSPTSNMPVVGASRVSPTPPPPPPLPSWPRRNQATLEIRVNRPIVIPNQNLAMDSSKELPETSNGTEHSEETPKPKLKALHWDKVRASSDREMVWDHLRSSSFKLDEEMIETLFVAKITDTKPCQTTPRSIPLLQKQENRVLDPKKAQNISILLRALNVTMEEVCEALLEGNADTIGTELLENLLKMQPTKEEERKLKEYRNNSNSPAKLGHAEKFLMAILDIPSAFKRLEAMLYISNFDSEIEYLNKSFETLQAACKELRNSRMFLKLLEAVLKTGNRMNVGTARGDAHAFKLDTLLKLVDVKGTDGKTTLLHFVVQEIIRLEGTRFFNSSQSEDINCKKLSLEVVSSLSSELSNVKKAAAMDSEILSNDVFKLSQGISKIKDVIKSRSLEENNGRFTESMNMFLKKAEEEIIRIQGEESLAVSMVKEITEYFHGNTEKEEAHPFRIFLVVRDFMGVVNRVCKDVEIINERTTLSSAQKFPVPMNPMLPRALPGLCGQKQCASSTSFSSDDELNSYY